MLSTIPLLFSFFLLVRLIYFSLNSLLVCNFSGNLSKAKSVCNLAEHVIRISYNQVSSRARWINPPCSTGGSFGVMSPQSSRPPTLYQTQVLVPAFPMYKWREPILYRPNTNSVIGKANYRVHRTLSQYRCAIRINIMIVVSLIVGVARRSGIVWRSFWRHRLPGSQRPGQQPASVPGKPPASCRSWSGSSCPLQNTPKTGVFSRSPIDNLVHLTESFVPVEQVVHVDSRPSHAHVEIDVFDGPELPSVSDVVFCLYDCFRGYLCVVTPWWTWAAYRENEDVPFDLVVSPGVEPRQSHFDLDSLFLQVESEKGGNSF